MRKTGIGPWTSGIRPWTSDLGKSVTSEVRGLRSDLQIAPPSPKIDSTDYNFAIACFYERVYFTNNFIQLKRTALATHIGDHTERAAIIATVLHLEVGAGTLVGGVEDRGGKQFGVGEDVGDEDWLLAVGRYALANRGELTKRHKSVSARNVHLLQNDLGQLMLVRIADDQVHSCQRRDFVGRTLRIASGHHNSCVGILSLYSPNRRPRILVRRRRNRARIQYHDGSQRRRRRARKATLFELALESSPVRLRSAASKVFYEVSRHDSMLAHGSTAHTSAVVRAKLAPCQHQADAAVLRELKHSRQKTGRPWVGRKGTVVTFPQPEQVAWVSTLV